MLGTRRHYLFTDFTVGKFTDLGHGHQCTAAGASICLEVGRWVQFKQFHVHLYAVFKLVNRAIRASSDVLRNCRVHALDKVLALINVAWDSLQFFELFWQ